MTFEEMSLDEFLEELEKGLGIDWDDEAKVSTEAKAVDELATNLVLIADEHGADIGKAGLKPACLRGVAYGLLFMPKLKEDDGRDTELYGRIIEAAGRMERVYKLDGPRGVFAELAGVSVDDVEITDGEVTING